ncbi:MAG: response regulator transcription factor [Rhodothermales bacterium]|nr:response regulator transcription factor [Rhodothermales bacterium]
MTNPIRILIADDHPAFRTGVRDRLLLEPDMEIVAESGNGAETLQLARKLIPDVLLLDIDLPDMSGVEIARRLQEANSPVRVLILSAHETEDFIFRVVDHGAAGYLGKHEPLSAIVEAVRGVGRGEEGWLSRRIATLLMHREHPRREPSGTEHFTEREREVLQLLARGQSNPQIGSQLFIAESTVKKHVNGLYEKTGVHSRAAIVAWAWENGLVEDPRG